MLGQRRRRWANIKTLLFQRVVFAEVEVLQHLIEQELLRDISATAIIM